MKILLLRRIVGNSMMPEYRPGRIIVASGLIKPAPGSVVVASWRGKDIIKRVKSVSGGLYGLAGDNAEDSLSVSVETSEIKGVVL